MSERPKEQLHNLMKIDHFPRSSKYDPAWVIENEMGPNVLWLTEFLCEAMNLIPGMRVLDLGCGKALSSMFLAREFNVQVWATDLWVSASENAQRIRAAQLDNQVFPIHADARSLPFADEFFDAIISVDAFEYFGTDATFLSSVVPLLKPTLKSESSMQGSLRKLNPCRKNGRLTSAPSIRQSGGVAIGRLLET